MVPLPSLLSGPARPLIDVVVPVRNEERDLEPCLRRLHAQARRQAVAEEENGFLRDGRRDLRKNRRLKKGKAERNSEKCWHRFSHARRFMFA